VGTRRAHENAWFRCAVCGAEVEPLTNGSYRNHCPNCLWSLHVDRVPGDRDSDCGGAMEPVALQRGRKRIQIEHCCVACGAKRLNRVAEDTLQPDDIDGLCALSARASPGR